VSTFSSAPGSPICPSVDAVPFTTPDHLAILAFRRKLRRKATWVVVSPEHGESPEAVEVYRPYEVPGRVEASWLLWRGNTCVWVYDKEVGILGNPDTVEEALEIIAAILKTEMRKAIRAIPPASCPRLPKPLGGMAKYPESMKRDSPPLSLRGAKRRSNPVTPRTVI
jgi:hypothetical protein